MKVICAALLLLASTVQAAWSAEAAPRVLRIVPDGERLWLGTTTGVWEVERKLGVQRVWTEREGLPSAVVYDLAKDVGGELWAATSGGPARKLGSRFEPMLTGLPAVGVTALLFLRSGTAYVGTARGIAQLGPLGWELVYETHEFGRDRVVHAAEGPDGSAWFAKERAITILRANELARVMYRDPLNPDDAVLLQSTRAQVMAFDVVGRLWLATDQGLTVLDEERVVLHERWRPGHWGTDGLPASRIWSIWFDAQDRVWLTFGDGPDRGFVARRPRAGGAWERLRVGGDETPPAVYVLARDGDDGLWAGTSQGLFRFEGDRFVPWPLTLPH